jgi:peptide/nickel transport system ATP-binding protein
MSKTFMKTTQPNPASPPLLRVSGLSLERLEHGNASGKTRGQRLLDDVSFSIDEDALTGRGECVGLVGQSGSGKTLTALAIAGVLPASIRVVSGEIIFAAAVELSGAPFKKPQSQQQRSAMVFQDARTALNPVRRIAAQLGDVLAAGGVPRQIRREAACDLLAQIGIDPPASYLQRYPFELSGGECQRVLLALALAREPRLLIADEPTTGLDTDTQARVLDLLQRVAQQRSMSMLLITHDLTVALSRCSRIAVMNAGRIVEIRDAARFVEDASEPYSRALIDAMPPFAETPAEPETASKRLAALLSVRQLSKRFGSVNALSNVAFDLASGEVLGVIGRSGSGKSTLAEVLARLIDADAGSIVFDGEDIATVRSRIAARASWRGRIQLVFQDARASLDPLSKVRDAIAAPLLLNGQSRAVVVGDVIVEDVSEKVEALATQVGLPLDLLARYPHELSGGEAARVGIARALASAPRLLILDEPTASLDLPTQADIIEMLERLCNAHGIAIILVSHDLDVVQRLCQRVLVIDTGRVVESGRCSEVFSQPAHPCTRALLDARPARQASAPLSDA